MITTNMRLALKSMGYMERKPGCWVKPVGFSLFTYEEGLNTWSNWFVPANTDKPEVWMTHKIRNLEMMEDPQYCIGTLAEWEAYSRIDLVCKTILNMNAIDLVWP